MNEIDWVQKMIDGNVVCWNTNDMSIKRGNELLQIKSALKLQEDILEFWLQLLDNGIGGLPTNREAEIFKQLSDIIPKELRDKKLEDLKQTVVKESQK